MLITQVLMSFNILVRFLSIIFNRLLIRVLVNFNSIIKTVLSNIIILIRPVIFNNKVKLIITSFLLVFCGFLGNAKILDRSINLPSKPENVYQIRSAADLNKLVLKPGDLVMMENGTWQDQQLVFRGKGTKDKPVRLTVAPSQKVILTGSSSLVIDGDWLIVDGLNFKDGATQKETVIKFSLQSSNCRLTNTAITDYNNKDTKIRNSWIVLYGHKNRVDHCYIKGKTNIGPTLHVGPTIDIEAFGQPGHHQIDHNYFAKRPELGRNGGETIVIGSQKWGTFDFFTLIEENIFEHCDGESEIISAKASHNTIRNNLFYECKGMLYLRLGNNNTIYGNYFIGNHVEGAGGVGIMGANHQVNNNYFQGLNKGISLRNAWENPPIHGYWQIKNTEIKENTLIDCKESFIIGWDKNERAILPPVNSLIANNVMVSKAPLITWGEPKAKDPQFIKFDNNIGFENPSVEVLPNGIKSVDPELFPNKLGVYVKREKAGKKKKDALLIDTIQATLFKSNKIGPAWMKMDKEFRIK
jgi:poly(beta-D-mannuronate) lyase